MLQRHSKQFLKKLVRKKLNSYTSHIPFPDPQHFAEYRIWRRQTSTPLRSRTMILHAIEYTQGRNQDFAKGGLENGKKFVTQF